MATASSGAAHERTRLMAHFEERSPGDQGSGWCELWDQGESNLWDRGKPSPPLIDLLERRHDFVQPITGGSRKMALVPGCGRGYDVVMLALHGFDAYGLEISSSAVAAAKLYANSELNNPSAYNFSDITSSTRYTAGCVRFVLGDFFHNDWETNLPFGNDTKFDIIYDYTFLCALPPSMRAAWARRMAELLTPGGLLVCLEFPLYKDPALPGPPWGLRGVHWDILACGGNGLTADLINAEEQKTDAGPGRGQFRRILYVQPSNSYEVGRGTDMLSVWEKV
ncbi:S-adenosyl-L-methionine-dependent methyltransferase [Lipomyces starkeyi]